MGKNNLKGSMLLTLAAFIWGLAFVAQSAAAQVPSFLVNCLRSFISAVFVFILYKITTAKTKAPIFPKDKSARKTVILGGLICGLMLTISSNFQQFGIAFYPDNVPEAVRNAHAGFITALYVVLVPIFSIFLRKKTSPVVWGAVGVALIGFYLLCFSGGVDGFYLGDLLILVCAITFSLHILSIDKYVGAVGGIRLSLLQFIVVGTLSGILSLIFERDAVDFNIVISSALPILYLGIMSSGVAYTLQIIGQKYAEPAVASISMSLESVFAALGGWFVGCVLKIGEPGTLSAREIIGCVLVFAAVILAQIPEMLPKKNK